MSKARILTAGAGSSRYATHVPTNILEKTFLAASSSFRALANPRDARLVGVVGETTGHRALGRMLARMKRDPIGRTILQDRPLIGSSSLPLASLRSMPDGSLGCEYARFLETHRFNPDERTAVNFIDDPELAYVMLRYRQVCSASVGRCALGLTLHLAPHAAGPVATSVLVAFRVRSTISGTWCLRCHQHFSERLPSSGWKQRRQGSRCVHWAHSPEECDSSLDSGLWWFGTCYRGRCATPRAALTSSPSTTSASSRGPSTRCAQSCASSFCHRRCAEALR
mmetsp:Transcript_23943/g.50202  ORF Transcript_23943/g.50202 Transcript_23943/m.50202 type:complete len:281 (+) Transcript_23943:257-1099(+)